MSNGVHDQKVIDESMFESMSWHDCRIHAFALMPGTYELALDIDYIMDWLAAEDGSGRFRFLVAPATLVFENVYNIKLEIETDGPIDIQEIRRENPRRPKNSEHIGKESEWEWIIETQQGVISFISVGFKQFTRCTPEVLDCQYIERKDPADWFARK